jgi:sulfofructose kinase
MDVVGIDNPVMDFLLHIDRIPRTNGFEKLKKYSFQGGGKISTALVTLGRLGIETGLIGVLGKDPFGAFCIEDFKRHNVDTSQLISEAGINTALSVCLVEKETNGRSFMINWDHRSDLTIEDLHEEYIASAKYLHLANLTPVTIEAARMARKNNVKVVIDADKYDEEIAENLKYIDILIGSEFFYRAACSVDCSSEENCRKLKEKGPSLVVITLGDKGCVCLDGDRYLEVPTFNELEVVDTCGAGDVFHGAFIFGMLKCWTIEKTARFACAVSSIKCTRPGGRAGIPDFATVDRFLQDGTIDYTSLDERTLFYENALFNMVRSD